MVSELASSAGVPSSIDPVLVQVLRQQKHGEYYLLIKSNLRKISLFNKSTLYLFQFFHIGIGYEMCTRGIVKCHYTPPSPKIMYNKVVDSYATV
jgi:hypothetical protein